MQAPEKLTLIGGSILLASTLIFTLKSQASRILPQINNRVSELFKNDDERKQDQSKQSFINNYQQAQQKHWITGTWGTSKYYVDNDWNMYVGNGSIQGPLFNSFESMEAGAIKTVNFVPGVQFPQDSSSLFQNMGELRSIGGLQQAHLPAFDSTNRMFGEDYDLADIDLSHFDTSHADIGDMLGGVGSHSITLGDKTILSDDSNPNTAGINNSHWKNGNQVLDYDGLQDGNAHPGTWVKQP